ncbi:MAG: DEAD/DEAH box helicase [Clostridiales bacterium]|jgi:ATP-dependent RNA helicase DeaD|nr:DEAD/DEAH box helicase [Clostridiales bacterium]
MTPKLFENMGLSREALKAVSDMGFEEATPIQSQCISLIMSGRDVIGQSQTGTGKTAAFGIPLLEKIAPADKHLQAVILCPTRELAIQTSEEFRKLLKYRDNIKVLPIYGGQPIDRQIQALKKGCQVIIGTPGRVMDHMSRRTLKMETVRFVVLDEADEMLDMGFRDDIETILSRISAERQTMLFSATMPGEILDLTKRYQHEPEYVTVIHKELTVPSIDQVYFDVKEKVKLDALCRLIDIENPGLALVFCNTKKLVDELVEQLQGRGYFAEGLHGDLKQPQRDLVMKKFRNRTLEILVATDVAARGLDVDDIDIVFNYDIPQDEEYYIHRIGRTGRAGKSGKAYSFVVGKEIYKLRDIMRLTKAKIERKKLPSLGDLEETKIRAFVDKIKDLVDDGHLTKYINIVEGMIGEDYSVLDIAAALMKNNLYDADSEEIDLESEPLYEPRFKVHKIYSEESKDVVRLFLTVGKKDKVNPNDIVGAIANETGVPGRIIGQIDIFDEFTFVDVPKGFAKEIITLMKNKKIKGKKINIERAKQRKGA